jgi:hypothetical protein
MEKDGAQDLLADGDGLVSMVVAMATVSAKVAEHYAGFCCYSMHEYGMPDSRSSVVRTVAVSSGYNWCTV